MLDERVFVAFTHTSMGSWGARTNWLMMDGMTYAILSEVGRQDWLTLQPTVIFLTKVGGCHHVTQYLQGSLLFVCFCF